MDDLRLFLPGLAARGSLYRPGLPNSWRALEPPPLSQTHGRFRVYRDWLLGVLAHGGRPVQLAGHSMSAALAITAAADLPDLVERLILFLPAGLPLSKPMLASLMLLVGQAFQGLYPAGEVAAVVTATTRHPWATYRLAREAHDLDLREEMDRVSAAGIPTLVVGCATDTLITPAICETVARRLGGECRQVEGGGHMWMLSNWPEFQGILDR